MDTIIGGHYLESELEARVSADASIFHFLQAGSLDGIWYWDLENPEHEWMSPRFWQLFGYEPGSKPHLASAWQDMVDPEDLKQALELVERHLKNPDVPYDQVVRYRHAEGHTIWVRCRGMTIRNAEGKPIRMLGAHTDITAQEQAKAELQAKVDELARSNAELEMLASVLGHDLREPLRKIVGFSELLKREYGERLDDKGERWLNFIVEAGHRLDGQLRDMHALSRVGGGQRGYRAVDLNAVIAEQRRLYDEAEIRVPEALPTVYGQPSEIVRLFQNLLSNAVKFNRADKACVEVRARLGRRFHELRVEDNGIGIAAVDRQRIFALFQRGHDRDDFEGSGLGLALVQKIVLGYGGRIRVEPVVGGGSCFVFTLLAGEQGNGL